MGLDKADDAAVYVLDDKHAIVQTLDFFAPLVDDPYEFGAIAAANALNDIYAMGADVLFALNIAAFPENLASEVVAAILAGGADKVREAGGAIAGGHTIIDEEPKYGLSVTGLVAPNRVRRNADAQPGDALFLTKPLGTGVIINALRDQQVQPEHERAVVDQMSALNRTAAEVSHDFDVHAMTDVTGFGLAGHCFEVAENSGMQVTLALSALPSVAGLRQYVDLGFKTGGQNRNLGYFGGHVRADSSLGGRSLSEFEEALLYDPQTCSGLLITVPESDAESLAARLSDAGVPGWRIGSVDTGQGLRLID